MSYTAVVGRCCQCRWCSRRPNCMADSHDIYRIFWLWFYVVHTAEVQALTPSTSTFILFIFSLTRICHFQQSSARPLPNDNRKCPRDPQEIRPVAQPVQSRTIRAILHSKKEKLILLFFIHSCHDEDGEDALSVCSIKAHAAFSRNMVAFPLIQQFRMMQTFLLFLPAFPWPIRAQGGIRWGGTDMRARKR